MLSAAGARFDWYRHPAAVPVFTGPLTVTLTPAWTSIVPG